MPQKPADKFADLHVHTNYSDGMFSPDQLVRKAANIGLAAVAITDHDCIDGIPPSLAAAKSFGIEIVPGIELSTAIGKKEIHILGYFIDWKGRLLTKLLRKMKSSRVKRMKKMIRLLRKHGIDIPEKEVFDIADKGTVGRLHLARVMVKEKAVKNLREAFDKYIGDGKVCCVKHKRLDYRKAIRFIIKSGGVAVLAHPGTMGDDNDIPTYVKAGLQGLEVFHSKHRADANSRYLALAKKYNLLITGGSDCHGTKAPGRELLGKVKVNYDMVEMLRKRSKKIDK